jgi:hypothetical protein
MVSNLMVKKCKPFTDGQFVKELSLEIADCLLEGFKNEKEIVATIQYLQLSRNNFVWRLEKRRGNIAEWLLKDVAFSLQLDKSRHQRHSPVTSFYLEGF